jgi:hypothetical protein
VGQPRPIVIDTNVFAVAEGMEAGATEECVNACLQYVLLIQSGYPLLVDAGDEIFTEYLGTLKSARTSGLAVKMLIALYRTRKGGSCPMVAITPISHTPGSYDEVPVSLRDFDIDDQKFIAVAAASGGSQIVAGIDGDWWDRQADFPACGLDVQFPCGPQLLAAQPAP